MLYHEIIRLKDGRECCLRNGTAQDGPARFCYIKSSASWNMAAIPVDFSPAITAIKS